MENQAIQEAEPKKVLRETDELAVPTDFWKMINARWNFDLDVCASQENTRIRFNYYDKETDALSIKWAFNRAAWCYPPASRRGAGIFKWMQHALANSTPAKPVVMLCRCDPTTRYWQFALNNSRAIFLINKRIKHIDEANSADYPQMLVEFTGYRSSPSLARIYPMHYRPERVECFASELNKLTHSGITQ